MALNRIAQNPAKVKKKQEILKTTTHTSQLTQTDPRDADRVSMNGVPSVQVKDHFVKSYRHHRSFIDGWIDDKSRPIALCAIHRAGR